MNVKNVLIAVVVWAAGTAFSEAAVPVITTPPSNQTNVAGTTAVFSVAATGSAPLAYQWTFDGGAIPAATNSELTLPDVQLDNAGTYAVLASNADGTTNSTAATLTVYSAPASLFFDDFSGPDLNPMWQTNLPAAFCGSLLNGYPTPALYVGAPNFGFQTLDGSSAIRLTNTLAQLKRCGWSSASNFITSDFRYEVRFNTMVQSDATSIDGFLEMWIIDATNSSRYDIVSPFGGWYSTSPYFFVGSTIDGTYMESRLADTNNTWYRLVLQGTPGQNMQALLLSDGGTELAGSTLAHGAGAYGSGFRIALSQVIGGAGSRYPVDVAVDYAKLTSGFAPVITTQPTNEAVAAGGVVGFNVAACGSGILTYQWSYSGTAINGATNSSLILTNVQAGQAGLYAVQVANCYGAAFSTNAVLTLQTSP